MLAFTASKHVYRMMLSFFLLGQVWDDHSMWNRDFSELCPSFTLVRLNRLELAVLEVLRVSVAIPSLDPTVDGARAAFLYTWVPYRCVGQALVGAA